MDSHRGFGIVDVIVGVALLAVASLMVWTLESSVLAFNTTAFDSMSEEADVLKFINTWASEVRSTQPAANGAYPIVSSATDSMAFTAIMTTMG